MDNIFLSYRKEKDSDKTVKKIYPTERDPGRFTYW